MSDFATVGLQVDSRPVGKASGELERFQRAGKGASDSATTATTAFAGMGKGLVIVAGAALGAVAAMASLGSAIRDARAFSGALAEAGTLIGGVASEMALIEAGASRMARTFGGTATQQIGAYYQAISAGVGNAAQATELLEAANRLAIGGVTTTTVAVGALSTAVNSYGKENLSAAEASDILFTGVRLGVTTIDELASAVGNVLPIANALGIGFEEVVAATAALTTQGLTTAQSVTGLRAALVAVTGPTSQAKDLAESLGLEFNSAALESQGFAGFMQSVIDATGGSTDSMRMLFGSVEATTAVMALAGGGADKLAEGLDAMTESAGATQAAYDIVAESLDQRLNVSLSTLQDRMRVVGGVMLSIAVPALEALVRVMDLLADNVDLLGIALGLLAARQIPAVVAGLITMSTWLATAEGLFIAGAIASRAMSVAMNLIPGVALFTGLTLALTGIYRGFKDSATAASTYATAIGDLVTTQEDLTTATDAFYQNMTRNNLDAMKMQAERVRDSVKMALDAAKKELAAASFYTNFFGASLFETNRMAEASASIVKLSGDLIEAEARLDAATLASEAMGGSLDDSEESAEGIARAAGLISFDGAAASARRLSGDLSTAIVQAQALAQFGSTRAGPGQRPGDPGSSRGPSTMPVPEPAAISFGGGGGGIASNTDQRGESLTALQAMLGPDDPTEAIEHWYETATTALEEARLLERGMMEEHNDYRLRIEQSYIDQLLALRRKQADDDLSHYQSFFGSMASAFQSGGEKMLGISKAFGLAEAAVSIWRGAAKALELPFPANLSAWATVIATGAKALQGISSTKAGSTSLSAGGGQAATAAPAPPPQSQNVVIDLVGATGRQIDQFQAFADTFNEASRQGLMTNVTVRGA